MEIREDKDCYSSSMQRKLLIELSANDLVKSGFFLTGGTALSVFYLHHRKSDDLDFFSIDDVDLNSLDFWILRKFNDAKKTGISEFSISYLIENVRVDFVLDQLSNKEKREKVHFGNDSVLTIDTIDNIVSNKLCTLVSRTEVKDYIDFYFLCKDLEESVFTNIYADALEKDIIFEDYPTVAYQIERGIEKILSMNTEFYPQMLLPFDSFEFKEFYNKIVKKIYKKIN